MESNPGPSNYGAGALSLRPRRYVLISIQILPLKKQYFTKTLFKEGESPSSLSPSEVLPIFRHSAITSPFFLIYIFIYKANLQTYYYNFLYPCFSDFLNESKENEDDCCFDLHGSKVKSVLEDCFEGSSRRRFSSSSFLVLSFLLFDDHIFFFFR